MADKETNTFDLAQLPAVPAIERPVLPQEVSLQVQKVREDEPRLAAAMDTVVPAKSNRLNMTVFENDSLKVSALGKVAGLNVTGKF